MRCGLQFLFLLLAVPVVAHVPERKGFFRHDAQNQLTNLTVAGQWKSEFVHDGLGRKRIERDYTWSSGWVQTNETRFIYEGMRVIQERDASNTPLVTYTRGLDLSGSRQGAGGIGGLLARTDANGSVFYHADGAGNVTALMDAQGYIVARYLYDPFGRQLAQWGELAEANRYRFSSKEQHPQSGLYDYGFRFYDPGLQRWLNEDPIGEAGGINLYGFVGNSPINRTDPFGLSDISDFNVKYADVSEEASAVYDAWMKGFGEGFMENFQEDYGTMPDGTPIRGGTPPLPGEQGGKMMARELTKRIPGTYKVCLRTGEKYIGRGKDVWKRLKDHVRNKKWGWDDVKNIFVEREDDAVRRASREMERLLEETENLHPKEVPDVLNKILPSKPPEPSIPAE